MRSLRAPAKCMAEAELISVAVVYALPDRQTIVNVRVPSDATVEDAVRASGLLEQFTEIARPPKCAIYGRAVDLAVRLRAGDRVEILRPLAIDPKEGRRRAAAQGRLRTPARK